MGDASTTAAVSWQASTFALFLTVSPLLSEIGPPCQEGTGIPRAAVLSAGKRAGDRRAALPGSLPCPTCSAAITQAAFAWLLLSRFLRLFSHF